MDTDDSGARFTAYVETLSTALGHADRVAPFRSYCTGLLLPGDRKSVEPMAARVEPARVQAAHQSLHHFVARASWSDEAVLATVRAEVLPVIERHGPINAWIVDDTGMPKQGTHSVGVARQYCGQLGKVDNCQVAVSLSVANDHASLPLAYHLYLPAEWADDPARCARAGVPDDVTFQTKPAIALDQVRAALEAGVPPAPVPADAAYGVDTAFRDGLTALGLPYSVGVQPLTPLWPPGTGPLPPKPRGGRGRKPTRVRRDAEHRPVTARDLALGLPRRAWRRTTWREGTNDALASRFAAARVRPACQGDKAARAEEWVLIEWPAGEAEPTKYWLSTLPATLSRRALVHATKRRWRIGRDYQDLKQELGLGQYEGRGWRGFHHHATLCIAAHGFLILERAALPPSAGGWPRLLAQPALPNGYRPRGTAVPAGAPRPDLPHDASAPHRARPRQTGPAMPMLSTAE